MRKLVTALFVAASSVGPALAADSWGLNNERALEVEGEVVDLLCEIAGDCVENCGGGKRQLGILATDGSLLAAAKGNVFFAGAVVDLLPYCGQTIFADGLLIENPGMHLYFVQYLKEEADGEWLSADRFQSEWTASHGEADEWWRADPLVVEVIEERGILGLPGLALPQ